MKKTLIRTRNKGVYISNHISLKPKLVEEHINLRKKSLALLDSRIKSSFANLNSLLNKINNSKDLVLNNKFEMNDIKTMKNLDNNCLFLSKSFRKEAKNAANLSYGYNLGSHDLDIFLKNLRKKKKKNFGKNYLYKNKEISKENSDNFDNFESYKNEFDLASLGLNKKEKIGNNSFLENQRKMRDLYNLKLELILIEQRKRIGEKRSFDVEKKTSNFTIDKDKKRKSKYDRIKSRYFEKYQLSKSFEIIDDLHEQKILKEFYNLDEKNDKEEIFITNKKEEKNKNKNKETLQITKKTGLKELNKINDFNFNFSNNLFKKTRKSFSARNINTNKTTKHFNINNSAIINSTKNTMNKKLEPKQPIKLRLKSGNIIISRNNIANSGLYNKIYNNKKNIHRHRNSHSTNLISSLTSKQTIYTTSKSQSRPISSFSSFNNTTYHFNPNKTSIKNNNINSLNSKKKISNYISEINKIITYCDYTTEKFKKATSQFNKKKLFEKTNNKIFERKKSVNIDKIIENLRLGKNPNPIIDEKKLVYNNSFKVKPLLTVKNRNILNTIILELFDEQRRTNKFFYDSSNYEKILKKDKMNKAFNLLSNKMISFEKKYDKEQILEMFEQDDELVKEFWKKKEMEKKFDEKEYKFILIKNKNMKLMDKENNRKKNVNGNLYKKHLVAKYKKIV